MRRQRRDDSEAADAYRMGHEGLLCRGSRRPHHLLRWPSDLGLTIATDDAVAMRDARPCYLLESRCARKNDHIVVVASMLRLSDPTNHSGSGPPPGQVCPPPCTM